MAATNNSVILYGNSLQLGNGVFGAGTSNVQTITFGGAPAAGAVTFSFWGIPFTISTASGLPTGATIQTALNAIFGTAYPNPFTVTGTTTTIVITASASGPFAFMPLPSFAVVTNTSLQTIAVAQTTPGVTQETYATMSGLEKFPWPTPKLDIETYMTLDLGTNGYKRKLGKFFDAGDVSATLVMTNDATQNNVTGFRYLFGTRLPYDWRIVEPTKTAAPGVTTVGSTYYFSAIISAFNRIGDTADARQQWNLGLAIDGQIGELPPLA